MKYFKQYQNDLREIKCLLQMIQKTCILACFFHLNNAQCQKKTRAIRKFTASYYRKFRVRFTVISDLPQIQLRYTLNFRSDLPTKIAKKLAIFKNY